MHSGGTSRYEMFSSIENTLHRIRQTSHPISFILRNITLLATVTLAAGICPGFQPDSPSFERAKQLYLRAVEGDGDAAREASKLFSGLHSQSPGDPLIRAYFGSLQLLESGRTLLPWKRAKLAKEGLNALDGAVMLAPEGLEVRYLRAISLFHLPRFFKREQQSAEDFAYLATRVTVALRNGALDPRFAASALYHHGIFLQRHGRKKEAAEFWRAATQTAPQSRAAAQAAEQLKGSS